MPVFSESRVSREGLVVVVSVCGTTCAAISCTGACSPCAIRPETLCSVCHDVQVLFEARFHARNTKNHVTKTDQSEQHFIT